MLWQSQLKVLPISASVSQTELVPPRLTSETKQGPKSCTLTRLVANARFPKKNHPGKDMTIFDYDRNLPQLDKVWPYPPNQVKALEHGAESRITLVIVDSMTNALANAEVEVIPIFHDRPLNAKLLHSDENGELRIEDSKASKYIVNIRKEGYYPTYTSLFLHVPGLDCVKDGKWQPWNPILAMTLKEKRNPGELIHNTVNTCIPLGKECYFDFGNASFLPPIGEGVSSNASIFVTGFKRKISGIPHWRSPWKIEKRCRFFFPGKDEGLIRCPIDAWSAYRYVYEAGEQGYSNETVDIFRFDGENDTKIDTGLTSGEYYIFRFRHKLNNHEREYRYGMIIHPISIRLSENSDMAKISFDYYISQTINDRNLETVQWLR